MAARIAGGSAKAGASVRAGRAATRGVTPATVGLRRGAALSRSACAQRFTTFACLRVGGAARVFARGQAMGPLSERAARVSLAIIAPFASRVTAPTPSFARHGIAGTGAFTPIPGLIATRFRGGTRVGLKANCIFARITRARASIGSAVGATTRLGGLLALEGVMGITRGT